MIIKIIQLSFISFLTGAIAGVVITKLFPIKAKYNEE